MVIHDVEQTVADELGIVIISGLIIHSDNIRNELVTGGDECSESVIIIIYIGQDLILILGVLAVTESKSLE